LPSQPVSEPGMVEARRDESANMALRRGIQREKSGLANGLFKRGRLSFGSQVGWNRGTNAPVPTSAEAGVGRGLFDVPGLPIPPHSDTTAIKGART